MLEHLTIKDPTPQALADEMHRLLTGTIGGWDVEEFEHKRIRDPQLHELWRRSLDVRRAPEEWVRMDEDHKQQIREIIRSLRELGEVRAAMKQSSPSPPEAN